VEAKGPGVTNDEATADRLHSAAIHLLRHVARVDAESGLSAARLSALSVIVYGGPITMTALAEAERVSPATVTSTVTGLETSGLVRRRREETDARRVTVEATSAGRALMSRSRQRRLAVLIRGFSGLSTSERDAIDAAVAAIERMLATDPCPDG
jgi:DNA-binding MarR family transcriptional regulator